MVNYALGKIYKIESKTCTQIYIGSTCEPTLAIRMGKHMSKFRQYLKGSYHHVTSFDILKCGDCIITLVEKYPCKDSDELRARESYWIENIDNHANKALPIRSKQEYRKSEQGKQIARDLKQKYLKDKFICECGIETSRTHHLRHKKSKCHIKKMEILQSTESTSAV